MNEYTIEGIKRVNVEFTCEASTRDEAYELFKEAHPGFVITSLESSDPSESIEVVEGTCENCNTLLDAESDDWTLDEDGEFALCLDCAAALGEDDTSEPEDDIDSTDLE